MEKQRIYGLNNEDKIIDYLNKKTFSLLNQKWKGIIFKIFPNIKDDDLIIAKHFPDKSAKPDMILYVGDEEKYISIKTGKCPSMHQESYYSFKRFLKNLRVSNRTLQIIRFFHFGDSKKLHTGNNPLNSKELKERYSNYFLEASKELDKDRILRLVIDRTVIRGTNSGRTPIDFLYYGDLEHGNVISKKEIYEMILAYREHDKMPIHFGGLAYMPNSRNPDRRERNFIRIKWPLLSFLYYRGEEDIEKMKKGTFSGS